MGDGELSHHCASAQETPAETAIFSAWTSTVRSMPSSSAQGRSRQRCRPVSRINQRRGQLSRGPAPVSTVTLDGAGSMHLILPH